MYFLNGQYVDSEGKDGDTIAPSCKSDINILYQFVSYFEFVLAIGMPPLQPAGIAGPVAAIPGITAQEDIVVFIPEKFFSYPDVDMLPGQ